MQQITAFSLGFMKINCLGKLMKFQYKMTADQKQEQRVVKYLLPPLAHTSTGHKSPRQSLFKFWSEI